MKNFTRILSNFAKEESGQDLIEYALVASLLGLGAVASMQNLSAYIQQAFNRMSMALNAV